MPKPATRSLPRRDTTAVELLQAAIDVTTEGNQSAFGRALGHSDGSRVRAWLRGERELPPTIRILCRMLVDNPRAATWLIAAMEAESAAA